MVPNRPYGRQTIEQLEVLSNNSALLTEQRILKILEELAHRKTDRSVELARRLRAFAKRRGIQLPPMPGAIERRVPKKETPDRPAAVRFQLDPTSRSDLQFSEGDGAEMTTAEDQRLKGLFDELRLRLLDLTKRNRMLNYPVRGNSKRQVQFHDEIIEDVYSKLVGEDVSLRISALPEPSGAPAEEKTEEFVAALEHAKHSDLEYLVALEAIEAAGGSDEATLLKAEGALRDRTRIQLGLPPRQRRADVNRAEHARTLGIDPNPELNAKSSKPAHTDSLLQTLLYPDELERQLDKISAEARLAEQEAGLSTLHIGLGFLEWYESDASDKANFAPLLLLPVKIETSTPRGKKAFYVSAREETAESNVSLQKFLESDKYGRALPTFGSDDGDTVQTIEQYFAQVQQSIQGLARWQIHRWLVLGHFAFNRIAIYEDTNPEKWPQHPALNPLVRSLLSGSGQDEGAAASSLWPEDYDIDSPKVEELAPVLVQDADASQHSALVDLMQGKNLVIHGPPGTGKSQTITNVIANVLSVGKTVLFLAEKQAALEVVKRRLDASGLGEFCLELHSDKSAPKAVVHSLERRLQTAGDGRSFKQPVDPTWRRARDVLNSYANAMNLPSTAGATPFEAIWAALRTVRNDPNVDQAETLSIPKEVISDPLVLADARGRVQVFADLCGPFSTRYGAVASSPWTMLERADLSRADQQDLMRLIRLFQDGQGALDAARKALADEGVVHRDEWESLKARLDELPAVVDEGLVTKLSKGDLGPFRAALDLSETIRKLESSVADLCEGGPLPEDAMLELAVRLVSSELDPGLISLPAKEMVARLDRRATAGNKLQRALEELSPTLSALQIDEASSLSIVSAAALGATLIGKIPSELRSWMPFVAAIDHREFSSLRARWIAAIKEEDRLSRLFDLSGLTSWPSLPQIELATSVLRRPALSRFVSSLGSEEREVSAFLKRMDMRGNASENAADLEKLARHLKEVLELPDDRTGRQLFGDLWKGIRTPLDDVVAAGAARKSIAEQLAKFDPFHQVVHRIFQLGPDALETLERNSAAADAWLDLIAGTSEGALSPSAKVAKQGWRRALDDRSLVASIDPSGYLATEPLSVEKMAELRRSLVELRSARSAVSDLHAPPPFDKPILDPVVARALQQAAEWVAACPAQPETVRARLLEPGMGEYRRKLAGLVANHATASQEIEKLKGELSVFFGDKTPDEPGWAQRVGEAEGQLQEFVTLNREATGLRDLGIGSFVEWAHSSILSAEDILGAFSKAVAQHAATDAIDSSAVLARASGNTLDAQRKTFVDQDKRRIETDRANLRRKLSQVSPPAGIRSGPARNFTEMGLLQREFARQRGHTKVRGLMRRAGETIRMLKPCTMMSPLSLAKYLDASPMQYDVLVIDEASQMKPEDALGAMLRVSQIVVVGDQKQLPPTNFFDRTSESAGDDEGELDDVDDESILERCQKVFGNVRQLKWHYRSRCESLIRFSNENFYDNKLITFPAPEPGAFSIDLVRVDGTYQSRRNLAEAERVAEEAIRFMRAHADLPENETPTLGIVAINTDQRDLIRETINRYEGGDDAVTRYRAKVERRGEEVFVKNLENVQGDERDYIFISLTYGRKAGATVVEQRFGPINSKQGHRRLNVLFSRARQRIALFTSMGSVDTKPSETSNDGVVKLQRYLEYVEQKGRMSYQSVGREADSDFETAVADLLRGRGYDTLPQVGVSGFRIDLGVLDPDRPGHFLAGVECDGAPYHSSKSARDRDRIRQEVLEGLGWTILRVWSTDWFANPALELQKLATKLDGLRANDRNSSRYAVADLVVSIPPDEGTDGDRSPIAARVEEGSGDPIEVAPPLSADLGELLEGEGSITERDAYQLLAFFRQSIVAAESEAEPHRSILREGMIETFVRQRVADPEDWFTKVPQFQRSATDAGEKQRYLETICSIVARIGSGDREPDAGRPVPVAPPGVATPVQAWQGGNYQRVDFASSGLSLDPSRLYDIDYRETLVTLIDTFVSGEGPIFADVLAIRVARAHEKDRTGNVIQSLVSAATKREYPRTREGERTIVWPLGSVPGTLVPFRDAPLDVRSYEDIPEIELASFAAPYLALKMDEEGILQKFAEHFSLQRLRATSRSRFASAIRLARAAASGELSHVRA